MDAQELLDGIIELQDGKIKRNADYWDMLTYLQQVGLLPETPVG